MEQTTYEVVEKNKDIQYRILAGLVEDPLEGVAYLLMMSGEPLSSSEITGFLMLSDTWMTERFDRAVVNLEVKGLIREVVNLGAAEAPHEWSIPWAEALAEEYSTCTA